MDQFIQGFIKGMIAIALVAVLAFLFAQVRHCPKCHHPLKTFRKPESIHEFLWGGWRCPECRSRISRTGRLLP
jgi:uncharacterized protein with PIN domain